MARLKLRFPFTRAPPSLASIEHKTRNLWYLDVPDMKLGSMVIKWVISPINGVYWGYKPLILTIDPSFQRDIQVVVTLRINGGFFSPQDLRIQQKLGDRAIFT